MSRIPDAFDYADSFREGGTGAPPTCNRCGAEDLEWVDIGGRPARWKLYEGRKPHVCRQTNPAEADEFEDLGSPTKSGGAR